MKCPFCGNVDDKVLETRIQKEGESIRRRRECLKCASRFTTQEVLILQLPAVIKKDGRRENFSKQKILHGIQVACQKRGVSKARIEAALENILKWALKTGVKEIPAELIGSRVLQELREIDPIAHVRFASVHKNFSNLNQFIQELGQPPKNQEEL